MAQPTPYVPATSFSDHTASQPDVPQDGTDLDAEFQAIKLTTDQVRANLALLQRDDGALANGIVTPESLSDEVYAGISRATPWATATAYRAGDLVWFSSILYATNSAFTSTTNPTVDTSRYTLVLNMTATVPDIITQDAQDAADAALAAQTAAQTAAATVSSLVASVAYLWAGTAGGVPNTLVLTPQPALAAYTPGHKLRFVVASNNTTSVQMDTNNALGPRTIKKSIGGALVALAPGDLQAGTIAEIEYISDAAGYQLLNPPSNSQGSDIASSATVNLDAANGDYVTITGTTGITGITLVQGRQRTVTFAGVLTLTHSAGLLLKNNGANITTAAGDSAVFRGEASGVVRMVSYERADGSSLASSVLRNHIDGYQMSTAGASTTMTIGAGQAANSTNAAYVTLASSISKTTGSWAVGTGNGGLDTGTIANSTWYHFYAIRRPDTGVVDVVFSTNATSPTLPTNYTQFRRIGSAKTNGSGQWVRFFQDGDNFVLDVSVEDISSTNPGTSAVTRTLASVPTGIVCYANIQTQVYDPSSMLIASLVTSLDKSDETPVVYNSGNNSDNATFGVGASVVGGNVALLSVKTNTSAQVRSRLSGSNAGTLLTIRTRGWIDTRGKQ